MSRSATCSDWSRSAAWISRRRRASGRLPTPRAMRSKFSSAGTSMIYERDPIMRGGRGITLCPVPTRQDPRRRAGQPLFMCRDVVRAQAREPLQLDRGLAAVESNEGVAVAGRHIAVALQVAQRLAFQVQLVLARDEVGDHVRAANPVRGEGKQIVAGATGHRGVAGAADEGVVAGAALHDDVARAADKLGAVRPAHQRGVTTDDIRLIERVVRREAGTVAARAWAIGKLRGATLNGDAAEESVHRGATGLSDRVVAVPEIDGVVTARAALEDVSRAVQGHLIVARADRDRAVTGDVNGVVAVAGDDGAIAVNVDVRAAAAGDADIGRHLFFSPHHRSRANDGSPCLRCNLLTV